MITPEQQLKNLARVVKRYTELTRLNYGRGCRHNYPVDKQTIATAARQLADAVERYLAGELESLCDDSPF